MRLPVFFGTCTVPRQRPTGLETAVSHSLENARESRLGLCFQAEYFVISLNRSFGICVDYLEFEPHVTSSTPPIALEMIVDSSNLGTRQDSRNFAFRRTCKRDKEFARFREADCVLGSSIN